MLASQAPFRAHIVHERGNGHWLILMKKKGECQVKGGQSPKTVKTTLDKKWAYAYIHF